MNYSSNKCLECGALYHDDFVRCPVCNAYITDASPWKSEYALFAIAGASLGWLVIELVFWNNLLPFADVFSDGISKTILWLALYGMFAVTCKWRVATRQIRAFHLTRQLCAVGQIINDDTLDLVKNAIRVEGLGPYNNLIAYQRLQWISQASHVEVPIKSNMFDALRQHTETDWDSLENSFSVTQFLIWLLPTAGFLGTVYGMTRALRSFSEVVAKGSDLGFTAGLTATAQGLGVAFHTTLIGLAAVIPLLAFATALRRRSQMFLEQIDKYFLRMLAGTKSAPEETSEPQGAATEDTPSHSAPALSEGETAEDMKSNSPPTEKVEVDGVNQSNVPDIGQLT